MSVVTWLKSWVSEQMPEKKESIMVAESLFMELEYQMRAVEEEEQGREKETRREAMGGVDYSWLATSTQKTYEIPQLERLELEEVCMKIKPSECSRVITSFREALVREPQVHELPRIMRAAVNTVLEGRPKEDTMPEWISKSLTSLSSMAKMRPAISRRITPINPDADMEMRGSSGMSTPVSTISVVSTSDDCAPVLGSDSLPV